MKIKTLFNLLAMSAMLLVNSLALSAPPPPPPHAGISPEQKKAIEVIIEDYIVTNPEILMRASKVLQQRQQQAQEQQARQAIVDNAKQLFAHKISPVVGNEQGPITLVEFFDYQCVHCKRMTKTIEQLVKENPKLKVIYKQFPIFGETSQYAAKAAIAARQQGVAKFKAFHHALMAKKEKLSKAMILDTAKSAGLDMSKLKAAIASAQLQKELDNNMDLAEKIGIRFTPVFIIAKTPLGDNAKPAFVPGAVGKATLQKLIEKAEKD